MVGCRHAYYIITCYVLHPLLLARFVREGSAAWRPAARGTNPYYEVLVLLCVGISVSIIVMYKVLRISSTLLFFFALSDTPPPPPLFLVQKVGRVKSPDLSLNYSPLPRGAVASKKHSTMEYRVWIHLRISGTYIHIHRRHK